MVQQINDQLRQRATSGGLWYDYVPSADRDKWARMISGLSEPRVQAGREWEGYKAQATKAATLCLPEEVKSMLREFAHTIDSDHDGMVIDNLPHSSEADQEGGAGRVGGPKSEAVLVGLVGAARCEVFSYEQEKQAALIQKIKPEAGKENSQSNAGIVKFNFHSDNAFLRTLFQPELLGLLGSVNQSHIATLLLTLEQDILPNVPAKLLRVLREAIFRLPAPDSFDFGGCTVISAPRPLIYDDEYGRPHVALPGASFPQGSCRAARAMREFREFLDSLTPREIVVGPGRFLAFRNTRVVHGRNPISGQRLLHRAYFTRSLSAHRKAARSGRKAQVFDALQLLSA